MKTNITSIEALGMKLLLFIAVFSIISCGGNQNTTTGSAADMNRVQALLNGMEFEIENRWAMPRTGERVNLIANDNHIRFYGDSVNVFLPYFGVRQMADRHPRDGGIRYEGLANNLRVEENDGETQIRFESEGSRESLQFYITIAPSGNTNTNVNSSHRDAISYQGEIKEIDKGRN